MTRKAFEAGCGVSPVRMKWLQEKEKHIEQAWISLRGFEMDPHAWCKNIMTHENAEVTHIQMAKDGVKRTAADVLASFPQGTNSTHFVE